MEDRFGAAFVGKIENLSFDEKGLKDVIQLLESHDSKIDTSKLHKQIDRLKHQQTKDILRQLLHTITESLYPAVRLDWENLEKSKDD